MKNKRPAGAQYGSDLSAVAEAQLRARHSKSTSLPQCLQKEGTNPLRTRH